MSVCVGLSYWLGLNHDRSNRESWEFWVYRRLFQSFSFRHQHSFLTARIHAVITACQQDRSAFEEKWGIFVFLLIGCSAEALYCLKCQLQPSNCRVTEHYELFLAVLRFWVGEFFFPFCKVELWRPISGYMKDKPTTCQILYKRWRKWSFCLHSYYLKFHFL